jgi:sugar lactone lactonase YvrE
MQMNAMILTTVLALLAACRSQTIVKEIANSQNVWTGVAVSKEERIFVNFPRWEGTEKMSVAEIMRDGTQEPFPNPAWNDFSDKAAPASHFLCVQSVYVDQDDDLWILDSGNPFLRGVIRGGAKLVKVDLATNRIVSTIIFDSTIATRRSYLNDVRIDSKQEYAYITDSGNGAIIAVDLKNRKARRFLSGHISTTAQNISFVVEGVTLGAKIHSDGIAFDAGGGYLYFKPLTGNDLFRIQTRWLRDNSMSVADIGAKVEFVAQIGITDGMEFGDDGNLYFTALEHNEIRRITKERDVETVVHDADLKWPDSIALRADGTIYCTTSQLHLGRQRTQPNRLFRITPK